MNSQRRTNHAHSFRIAALRRTGIPAFAAKKPLRQAARRLCIAGLTILFTMGCTAFKAGAQTPDTASYRQAVRQIWAIYQAGATSPIRQIRKEIQNAYAQFDMGMQGVTAAVSGQPLPALGEDRFDDDIARLEQKIDALTVPDLPAIPAFPIGIMGLSRDALRQEIRAGVGFIFAAHSGMAIGQAFIHELQSNQDNLNQFAHAIQQYGQSLDPLLALGYLPHTQKIAFTVLDLQYHYPQELQRIAGKLSPRKEVATRNLTVHQAQARAAIDYLIAALDAEDRLLQQDRQTLTTRSRQEQVLADSLAEQTQAYTHAVHAARQSEDALEQLKSALAKLEQAIAQNVKDVQQLNNEIARKRQEAHNAYGVRRICPNQQHWDDCQHDYLKNQFMSGDHPEPLSYRLAMARLANTQSLLEQNRRERDSQRRRLPELDNKAADDKRIMAETKQKWQAAVSEKDEYTHQFEAWKKRTKIALYSDENKRDRLDLAQLRGEFN